MATPPPEAGIYSKPTGLFTDDEFLNAAKQVQNPDLPGWEFFVESMGVKMYRKYSEVRVWKGLKIKSLILFFRYLNCMNIRRMGLWMIWILKYVQWYI